MKFIILFEDDPNADPDIRKTHMPAHLSFLENNADHIETAGPLTDQAGAGQGGLWVVDAQSETDVERLISEDPFWPTGLRKSFKILRWTQVFAHGVRQIRT